MQSSASSSSPKKRPERARWLTVAVWAVRVVVGALFIVSGVSKAIDPWGFIYKIEEYTTVWGWALPRSLALTGAVALSMWEGLGGFMLLLGCYRRSIVALLLFTMAFLLPFSAYIAVANPVADCGCFGDFMTISNSATLVKNVVITALLIFLWIYNRRVGSLISPAVQWLAGTAVTAYLLVIAIVGYSVQPMIDFRAFPIGTLLADDDESDADTDDFIFIYEKDGEERTFTADDLPDSSWTFVDRRLADNAEAETDDTAPLAIYDGDEDVTADAISAEGPQLLVLIPDIARADISFTYYLNALNHYITRHGGSMTGIVAADPRHLERWTDLSGASYPIYTADPTLIKTIARGNVALVYLTDGRIRWKRSASSIDGDAMLADLRNPGGLNNIGFDTGTWFTALTWGLAVILIFIIFADGLRRMAAAMIRRSRHKPTKSTEQTSHKKTTTL